MKYLNRFDVAENLARLLKEAEEIKAKRSWWRGYEMRDVCDELNIFDWWVDRLSISQMREMQRFLKTACELGYNGYVCFKVGAKYCSHGMWAHKAESTDGYSPNGEVLYHSFRSGDNYWDAELPDGKWMHEKHPERFNEGGFTLREVKAELGL